MPKGAAAAKHAASASECVIEGPGNWMTRDFVLFALPDASSPIAHVSRPADVPARISLLPDSSVAAVTLLSPTLELYGFVPRKQLRFVTRERVLLAGRELFVERGRIIEVSAVNGDRVTADVRSPFQQAPTTIQISCENLAYADGAAGPIRSQTVSWASLRASGPIAMFDAPGGSLLLRAEVRDPMRVLESRDGFTHVSIGDAGPWCYQGVVADVWVAASDLAAREEPADQDDACFSVLDGVDLCPGARAAKRTELWLGAAADGTSDLQHIGWLKQGTPVTLGKARDRVVEIRLNDQLITAPPTLSFFAERASITGGCVTSAQDDGCPCDEFE
jgi:hypothetical protein